MCDCKTTVASQTENVTFLLAIVSQLCKIAVKIIKTLLKLNVNLCFYYESSYYTIVTQL